MARLSVTEAYKTDHFPLEGNISEEVLVLEDGRAFYLNPEFPDEPCDSKEEAFSICIGTPMLAPLLWNAWQQGGYDMGDQEEEGTEL